MIRFMTASPKAPKTTATIMNPQTGPRKLAITSEA